MSQPPAPAVPSPDAELVRRASRRIGLRVALACAALVVGGASVFFGYLWWEAAHPGGDVDAAYRLDVNLDLLDLATAALLAGAAAVLITGFASVWFARSAVAPLVEALRRQREFVSNASHELRTPLTVLSARAQILQARVPSGDPLRPLADDLRRDTDTMAGIVEDMLSIARLDDAPEGTCDVGEVAARTCADLDLMDGVAPTAAAPPEDLPTTAAPGPPPAGAPAPRRTAALRSTVPSLPVAVPEAAVRRMLVAVLDNALGFAPPGTEVTVSGERLRGGVVGLRVRDHGGGIQGVDPDHVFDRFARGRAAPVPGSVPGAAPRSSHGIGLALVRETARRYGGDARVESTGPEGTAFLLTLPEAEGAR